MRVIRRYPTNQQGRVFEFGEATWNPRQMSVRNRYPTRNGGFSPRSSSELPIGDLRRIIEAVAQEDILEPEDIAAMISALSDSLGRRPTA